MPVPIYSINDLCVSKKDKNLLTIKQFDIHRGACYVFEGRMGAGKTTFLEVLYLRKKPNRGTISFEENNIYSYSHNDYQDQIAIVPQSFEVPWGSVKKYMIKTISKFSYIKKAEKKMNEICNKMNIDNLLERPMKTLTPGELRWILLATMIAADSKVLFIDEIELHLGKKDISNLLSILHKKIKYDGVTLITSTQNRELIKRIASVTITLDKGRIISVRSSSKKKGR